MCKSPNSILCISNSAKIVWKQNVEKKCALCGNCWSCVFNGKVIKWHFDTSSSRWILIYVSVWTPRNNADEVYRVQYAIFVNKMVHQSRTDVTESDIYSFEIQWKVNVQKWTLLEMNYMTVHRDQYLFQFVSMNIGRQLYDRQKNVFRSCIN